MVEGTHDRRCRATVDESRVGDMTTTADAGADTQADEGVVHILWMNGGLSCDGDSVALTAATQPSIEEIVLGALTRPSTRRATGPASATIHRPPRPRQSPGRPDFISARACTV